MQSLSPVEKAIDLLFHLHAEAAPRGVTAVGKALDLPKSSAHRLLSTLARRGLLERDERGQYCPGIGLVALGLGVGIAPQLVIEASGMREQVDFLPLDEPLPPLSVGLCCLRNRLESPLLAAFWGAARQAYASGV